MPKADVQLVNTETNAVLAQATNEGGQYTFPSVTPGNYKLTVTKTGFRTASVQRINVDVNKSANVPVTLEVGSANQVVEVQATAAVELQTQDAQIGNVLETDQILRLPTLQRNVTELLMLQPGVVQTNNSSTTGLQMRVAGAIEYQNTVTIDGIDNTQSVVASGTVIPTPADSVEEFKVNVANPNAAYDRGSGGQMTLIGRHGTNTLHGAAYEYLQNSDLNTNTWDLNRVGIAKAPIKDNRFGARLGGPIKKDKTFLFGNYEGRRFSALTQVNRAVPTDTLKQGILQFRDASGAIQQYNLATSTACGPSGGARCDPRGLGISPSVKAQFAEMPAGNLPGLSGTDGLNTTGFIANISTPTHTDYGVARLDHVFSERLTFNGNYTYFRNITMGSNDVSIRSGMAPQSVISTPQRGQVLSGGLTWQIRRHC